jgi:putative two-component system response regulator
MLAEHDLPDATGVELCAQARARWPDTARVLLTGLADLETLVRALHGGGVARLLQKPLRDADVLAALREAAESFERAQRERHAARADAEDATARALARLAKRRDDETGWHLERVSRYCRLIAHGLSADGRCADELTDRFVQDLVRAAPLHDIGKVGIPDAILDKPGKLDAAEWEVMRTHPALGADALRALIESTPRPGFLRLAHDVALCHHERWDGGGYPRGLSGDAIPLSARIVALADVYDALTTRRPYKEPWPHARALELIASERGRHFDPDVVDAFMRRADEADQIRERFADEA